MAQTPQVGLPSADPGDQDDEQVSPQDRVVLLVAVCGVISVVLAWWWFDAHPLSLDLIGPSEPWLIVALLAISIVSELLFFPVRHGDVFEELTYFEFVMVGALLLYSPTTALPVLLAGTALAELMLGRPAVKRLFNIGSYAIATCALFVTYWALADQQNLFSLRSVAALLFASVVWGAINLILLSWILQVAEGIPVREFLADKGQWIPTLIVAFLSVSVAASFVALLEKAPALTVFTVVPTAVLWYVYQAAQRRSEAVDRVRYTVGLSTTLATPQPPAQLVASAADNVRRFFGAEDVIVVTDGRSFRSARHGDSEEYAATPTDQALADSASPEARTIPSNLLPPGWRDGSVIRLDLSGPTASALALGTSSAISGLESRMPWARGGRFSWKLASDDRPVLASLAGSVSSAMRAGELFTDLQEETAKLTAVVDHASDGIAVFDSQGDAVLWSPAMTTITGLEPADLANPVDVHAAEVVATLAQLRGLSTGAEGRVVTITRSDGEDRELNVAVVAIQDEGHLSVLTVRDVTMQRRLDRMKSDFIATAAHELRTPITPIKGYAQLLATRWDKMTPEKRTNILGTIEERASHLSRLVDDLMLATRVSDTDKVFEVKVGTWDLAELVDKAVAGKTDLADRLTVTGTAVTVVCDPTRTLQCLDNLISNASKYSASGTPITVAYGHVSDDMALIEVTDQGRGIPSSEVDKVFEKFYRVEDPMTMTTGGQGLGLFLSREFARAMNGDISVTSRLGHGSTFTLRLPLAVEAP